MNANAQIRLATRFRCDRDWLGRDHGWGGSQWQQASGLLLAGQKPGGRLESLTPRRKGYPDASSLRHGVAKNSGDSSRIVWG